MKTLFIHLFAAPVLAFPWSIPRAPTYRLHYQGPAQ